MRKGSAASKTNKRTLFIGFVSCMGGVKCELPHMIQETDFKNLQRGFILRITHDKLNKTIVYLK